MNSNKQNKQQNSFVLTRRSLFLSRVFWLIKVHRLAVGNCLSRRAVLLGQWNILSKSLQLIHVVKNCINNFLQCLLSLNRIWISAEHLYTLRHTKDAFKTWFYLQIQCFFLCHLISRLAAKKWQKRFVCINAFLCINYRFWAVQKEWNDRKGTSEMTPFSVYSTLDERDDKTLKKGLNNL